MRSQETGYFSSYTPYDLSAHSHLEVFLNQKESVPFSLFLILNNLLNYVILIIRSSGDLIIVNALFIIICGFIGSRGGGASCIYLLR